MRFSLWSDDVTIRLVLSWGWVAWSSWSWVAWSWVAVRWGCWCWVAWGCWCWIAWRWIRDRLARHWSDRWSTAQQQVSWAWDWRGWRWVSITLSWTSLHRCVWWTNGVRWSGRCVWRSGSIRRWGSNLVVVVVATFLSLNEGKGDGEESQEEFHDDNVELVAGCLYCRR